MRRLACFVVVLPCLLAAGGDVEPAKVEVTPIWAGVSVSRPIFDWRPQVKIPGEVPQQLMLYFTLVNDSDKTVDPEVRSSELLINGKPFERWQFRLGNGPRDEWRDALPAGEFTTFSFGMNHYFQKPGIYRIMWKGKRFQSREIEFRVIGPNPG
jgi:hypothetical protein